MDAIKAGNLDEVLKVKKNLESRVAKLRPRNLSLDELRCAFAVNRALSRIAAYEAGIPAPIIHRITTRESIAIGQAKSSRQMEIACAQMLEEFLPVDSTQIGKVEDGFQILSNLQESDIIEAEGTVGNNTLKLLAQRLDILRGLQQIAAPVDSS